MSSIRVSDASADTRVDDAHPQRVEDDNNETLATLWPKTACELTRTAHDGIQELVARYADINERLDQDLQNYETVLETLRNDYFSKISAARNQVKVRTRK